MGKRCCVMKCPSRIKNEAAAVSLFMAPKNTESFNKWSEALSLAGTKLKKSSYVCEYHFQTEEIRNEVLIKDQFGKVLFQTKFQRKKLLAKGAVPSVFDIRMAFNFSSSEDQINCNNSDAQNSKSATQQIEKLPEEPPLPFAEEQDANSVTLQEELVENDPNDLHAHNRIGKDSEEESISTVIPDSMITDQIEILLPQQVFSNIWDETTNFKFPSLLWGIHKHDFGKREIIFTEQGNLPSDTSVVPWNRKVIRMNADMQVCTYVLHRRICDENMSENIKNIHDLENFVAQVHYLTICEGGPPVIQYKNIQPRCAYKDISYKWRHNSCTIKIENGRVCQRCATLDVILRRHLKLKEDVSKPRLILTPLQKKQLGMIRKAGRGQGQALTRSQQKLCIISKEINALREKLVLKKVF